MPSNDQRKGDWILLPSGTEFYVLDPRAEEIHISDIAHNLAHNCRFHGSCRKHYSVAEHSVYVAYLLRHEPLVTQLQALLHDATEAYLPDLAPQVKIAIPQFQTLEEGLWKEICRRFEIPTQKPFIIKAADMACLWPEFKQLLPPTGSRLWTETLECSKNIFPRSLMKRESSRFQDSTTFAVKGQKEISSHLLSTGAPIRGMRSFPLSKGTIATATDRGRDAVE